MRRLLRALWPLAAPLAAAAQWQAVPPPEVAEPEQVGVASSLEASVRDLLLAARGYEPLVGEADLRPLLQDHISGLRQADTAWERPPRRTRRGTACSALGQPGRRPADGRWEACEPADPALCLHQLLPLLLRETHHALAFVREHLRELDLAQHLSGRVDGYVEHAPLGGRALASAQALDSVLGLYLGLLERADFNPGLGACFGSAFGRKLREAVMKALEQQKRLSPAVLELRWELAANSRLAHARYGMHWHVDTAWHIVSQAGWALFELAKLEPHLLQKLEEPGGQSELLRGAATELDTGPMIDWPLELRTALHSDGEQWHLDKGLLRFLLANVLRQGDGVCDFGAFAGHYSRWLNDTGLVVARAFDEIASVEELTGGKVLRAPLDTPGLDVGPCDVALCLEVMEHIPVERETAALANLGRHAGRVLVLSWAPPWVPGVGHVNQRAPQEARAAVEFLTGLRLHDELTAGARAAAEVQWLGESVSVFVRPGVS